MEACTWVELLDLEELDNNQGNYIKTRTSKFYVLITRQIGIRAINYDHFTSFSRSLCRFLFWFVSLTQSELPAQVKVILFFLGKNLHQCRSDNSVTADHGLHNTHSLGHKGAPLMALKPHTDKVGTVPRRRDVPAERKSTFFVSASFPLGWSQQSEFHCCSD